VSAVCIWRVSYSETCSTGGQQQESVDEQEATAFRAGRKDSLLGNELVEMFGGVGVSAAAC